LILLKHNFYSNSFFYIRPNCPVHDPIDLLKITA
jgi:hypothetical protein